MSGAGVVRPAMIDPAQAKLAGRPFDEEIALERIEQSHAFGIERMRAHRVFARQQRQRGKVEGEPITAAIDAFGNVAIGFAQHAVNRRDNLKYFSKT